MSDRSILIQDTYKLILPPEPQFESDILFHDKKKGDQYWRRPTTPKPWKEMNAKEKDKHIERESIRVFETGVDFMNNGEIVHLPPEAYFFWAYWKMETGFAGFRKCQLLEYYFERFCENDPWSIGGVGYKKRRDGRTHRRMCKTYWKAIQSENSWLGIQSKTGTDAKDVCFKKLKLGWRNLPKYFKPPISGTSDPKTRLEFTRPATRLTKNNVHTALDMDEDDDSLNTTIDFRDTTDDAYDGQQLLEVTLDEFAKWDKASSLNAAYTYIKSCTLDGRKVGHIWAVSSPAEKNNKAHKQAIEWWEACDYEKVKDKEGWKFHRIFTSAIDSYAEAIDKYGDCDQEKAYKAIIDERNNAPESKKLAVIRQNPITIDEVLGSTDDYVWSNTKNMRDRKVYLMGSRFKDVKQTSPKYIFGNYEWIDGMQDTQVVFKAAPKQEVFTDKGRFAISAQPLAERINIYGHKKSISRGSFFLPPKNSEFILGIDPYDYRRTDSPNPSNAGAVMGKCFDFFGIGDKGDITGCYNWRPATPEMFYEDMIKWAVYNGAFMNIEARNKNIIDYIEDRGYFDFLLPKNIRDAGKEDIKGNPTTTNLIQEMCSLMDTFYGEDANLMRLYLDMLLEDSLLFDPGDTKKSNLTMAFGQMFLGFQKRYLLFKTKRNFNKSSKLEYSKAVVSNFF